MIQAATWQKYITEKLHVLGLSISYKRVDGIQGSVAKQLCDQFLAENLVIPKALQSGKYIRAATDKIIHNAASKNAAYYFPRTSITMFLNAKNHT